MNKFILINFLVLSLPVLAISQRKSNHIRPQIAFEQQKCYLDRRPKKYVKGDTIEAIFYFKNIGNAPLQIESVSSSCSCTVPSFSKHSIPPGGKGFVKLVTSYNELSVIGKVYAIIKSR
jgi:Protein of unknown function (DUF1573)